MTPGQCYDRAIEILDDLKIQDYSQEMVEFVTVVLITNYKLEKDKEKE